jgi:hypothetical protein
MNKIGEEERRIDPNTTSSFYPSIYKPKSQNTELQQISSDNNTRTNAPDTDASTTPVETPTAGLPYSSIFLPCHYFKYAGGTSTGGYVGKYLYRTLLTS